MPTGKISDLVPEPPKEPHPDDVGKVPDKKIGKHPVVVHHHVHHHYHHIDVDIEKFMQGLEKFENKLSKESEFDRETYRNNPGPQSGPVHLTRLT